MSAADRHPGDARLARITELAVREQARCAFQAAPRFDGVERTAGDPEAASDAEVYADVVKLVDIVRSAPELLQMATLRLAAK